MARGIPYPDDMRAAVLAALLAGQSVTEIAEKFQIHHSTVAVWRDAAGLGSARVKPEMHAELGNLVVRHVRSALLALEAQATVATDPEYLRAQPGSDLAVLYGVIADKAHRILAAFEPEQPDEPDP